MKNDIYWHADVWKDYLYWQQQDKKIVRKIKDLIKDITREPFSGIGKPEPLKYALEGCWSRRITQEHRLVYKIAKHNITIVQCRYHYG